MCMRKNNLLLVIALYTESSNINNRAQTYRSAFFYPFLHASEEFQAFFNYPVAM